MPSSSYAPMSNRGRMVGFNKNTVGGAVPLLLNKIIKEPIKGGSLDEPSKANIMVGMITKPFSAPEKVSVRTTIGGDLLNNLTRLKIGAGTKSRAESNIKFLF